jgi:hypothetical protein
MNPPPKAKTLSTTIHTPEDRRAAPPDRPLVLPADDPRAGLRRSIYAILIAMSVGAMVGRILAVNSVDLIRVEQAAVDKEVARRTRELTDAGQMVDQAALEQEALAKVGKQRPFLGANDRSRWATIRSLIEHGTYAIDDVIKEPNWDTIDMVAHDDAGNGPATGSSASMHYYSSKPTLLTTVLAGEYWLIYHLTGATLGDHPFEIGRFMLITFNVIPLAIYLWLLGRMVERYGTTDWGRIFVIAAAAFGTFLTTFAVVLNNHVTGAVTALGAVYAAARIWYDGRRELRYFIAAGLLAAATVADELPALSFFALLSAGLLWKAPKPTLIAYLPAALLVAVGFFGTNYIAHGSLRPPYMHRGEKGSPDDWYQFSYRGKPSYWSAPKGIDLGEPSPAVYAFQALIGHHGIFSLTPVWILAIPGVIALGWGRNYRLRELALLIATVTIVCVGFYLFVVPPLDRNYGGMTSGLRWVFWMAPLWLLAILPAADWLASRRWGRGVSYLLLGLSVLSASYPAWNPWTYPWLTNFFIYMGWTKF